MWLYRWTIRMTRFRLPYVEDLIWHAQKSIVSRALMSPTSYSLQQMDQKRATLPAVLGISGHPAISKLLCHLPSPLALAPRLEITIARKIEYIDALLFATTECLSTKLNLAPFTFPHWRDVCRRLKIRDVT